MSEGTKASAPEGLDPFAASLALSGRGQAGTRRMPFWKTSATTSMNSSSRIISKREVEEFLTKQI